MAEPLPPTLDVEHMDTDSESEQLFDTKLETKLETSCSDRDNDNDPSIDPETILSEKHLHRIFSRANLSSNNKVAQLGLYLEVPKQTITIVQVAIYPHDPVRQAVEICSRWRKGLPESDPKKQIKELKKALKKIGRTRAAHQLVSGSRERHSTFIDLQETSVWPKVEKVNKSEAIKLGLNLGRKKEEIDVILEQEKQPGIAALVLFIEWKSDLNKSGSEPESNVFDNALKEALENPYRASYRHDSRVDTDIDLVTNYDELVPTEETSLVHQQSKKHMFTIIIKRLTMKVFCRLLIIII